jgi:integrase
MGKRPSQDEEQKQDDLMPLIRSMTDALGAPPGAHRVDNAVGLYLRVTPTGSRSWVLRFRIGDKRKDMGLGSPPRVPLADARKKAQDALRQRDDGHDPIIKRQERVAANLAERATPTFAAMLEAFLETNGGAWKHRYAIPTWRSPFDHYALPVLGKLKVSDIQAAHVVQALAAAKDAGAVETARRLRSRIAQVLDFAAARGDRDILIANPASATTIRALFKNPRVGEEAHFRRLDLDDAPAALRKLSEASDVAPLAAVALDCWRLMIATGVRPSVALTARTSEFSLPDRVWIVPPAKMKTGKSFTTPLSPLALAVVERRMKATNSDRMFPGAGGGAMAYTTFAVAPTKAGLDLGTPHSWRSVFADWAGEIADADHEAVELQLAHILPKVRGAYRRGSPRTAAAASRPLRRMADRRDRQGGRPSQRGAAMSDASNETASLNLSIWVSVNKWRPAREAYDRLAALMGEGALLHDLTQMIGHARLSPDRLMADDIRRRENQTMLAKLAKIKACLDRRQEEAVEDARTFNRADMTFPARFMAEIDRALAYFEADQPHARGMTGVSARSGGGKGERSLMSARFAARTVCGTGADRSRRAA